MSHPVPPSSSVAELSAGAAELLHAAVRHGATAEGPGLVLPADAAAAVAALALVSARLPELLDLLATFLSSEQAAGRLGPDRAHGLDAVDAKDTLRAARDARERLYEAARTAAVLTDTLAAASAALAPVAPPRPPGPPATPHV
ncbi:hypothetical protein OG535_09960 [Kitasatospora sp. NBC_00085]|uniref:hypothetical protein n=1 Tax=unclassified Kitasatospora TaxID=2633591 RepID=UPI0032481C16